MSDHNDGMIKDGGPAFPYDLVTRSGMSLLQWYAGMALQGMVSNPFYDDKPYSNIAEEALRAADELLISLAARES